MPVDPIDEGDAFTAASLNSLFAALEADVNDLTRDNLRRRSLRDVHFDLGVITEKTGISVAPTGLITEHDYYNQYPGYDDDTFTEAHSTAPWGTDTWEVVESGDKARKTFVAPLTLTMAAGGVGGLHVLANLEVEWLNDPHVQGAIDDTQDELFAVAVAIMWQDSTDTWHVIPRTERFYTFPVIKNLDSGTDGDYARPFRDIAIRTLIVDADIDAGDGTVQAVQMVVATSAEIGSDPGASSVLECWQFGFTVIPLHAKEPA